MFTFLQVHLFSSMWAYKHHFRTEDVDDGNLPRDCAVEVEFDQSRHSSHHDENIIEGKLGEVRLRWKDTRDYASGFLIFSLCYFKCKWWDTFD